MPWNDNANNPGPWGSPPSGDDGNERKDPPPRRPPGGGGGGGGPRRPTGPELNAGLERLRQRIAGLFGGGGGAGGVQPGAIAAIAAVGFALWAASGFYKVQPNEEAVVTTFGAYSRNEAPGLHYHLPTPIEHVEKVAVTTLNRLDIGGTGAVDGDPEASKESLMLTSDENIIDVKFSVTWRVADASRFLFGTRSPEEAVKAVAESAMREVVGKTPLDPILNTGRGKVQLQAAELMQKTLDGWGAGVSVVEVQIRSANPPSEVVAAFRDVTNAQQDRDSAVNEANSYKNRVVTEAKGEAARITQSAEGYRQESVRTATGDAARFNSIYGEYKRAPQATRDRLYIETMERVLKNSNKVVISGKGVTAPVILPPDVFRPRSTPAQPAPVQVQAAPVQPKADPQ